MPTLGFHHIRVYHAAAVLLMLLSPMADAQVSQPASERRPEVGSRHNGEDRGPCWVRRPSGIHEHASGTASDPTVMWDADLKKYRMVFTVMDAKIDRTVIAQATSADGFQWKEVRPQSGVSGLILDGADGDWDENMETSFLLRYQGKWLLYYTGYRDDAPAPYDNKIGDIGLATSTDGLTFTRFGNAPILSHDPNGLDRSGAYSPSIIVADKLYMIYTGVLPRRKLRSWNLSPGSHFDGRHSLDQRRQTRPCWRRRVTMDEFRR